MKKNILTRLPVLSLIFAAAQADADSISFYLDQSNALLDGINYAQITISDSTTTIGDIDFRVEILSPAFSSTGSNFGMQDFSFNYDDSLSLDASNIVDVSESDWGLSWNKNAGGGFGKYNLQLSGNGNSRTELLTFSISGVTDDTIYSYAMGSALKPGAVEFFSTHIAGFDITEGVTSAKFAGSTAVVPVPASIWLFTAGLFGLATLTRRRT